MSLTELWVKSREQIEGKQLQQVIAFAGEGQLRDGASAADEFRSFLSHVPSSLLQQYASQCLEQPFSGSGFALQDIVNQVGQRLGFRVENGRYRGAPGLIGHDGLWYFPSGHAVVVEVKSTDAYRIDLNSIAGYRLALIEQGRLSKDQSSVLIVVGREDTGDLEAQIRGSRHAWDVRLISIDALMHLMVLKERVEDPEIIARIADILIPREFTKLDEIIDVVFSTAEDIKEEEPDEEIDADELAGAAADVNATAEACIKRIESARSRSLVRQTRSAFSSPDDSLRLILLVSRLYKKGQQLQFWFGFHERQKAFLGQNSANLVALACGSADRLLLIPFRDLAGWLDEMHTTTRRNDFYWHLNVFVQGPKLILHRRAGAERIDLTLYLI